MYIYLVKRNDFASWDEYDSFVVICESAEIARGCHPNGEEWFQDEAAFASSCWTSSWVAPEKVTVMCLGRANLNSQELSKLSRVDDVREAYIVNASFNAG